MGLDGKSYRIMSMNCVSSKVGVIDMTVMMMHECTFI